MAAKKVADYIGTVHHEINYTIEEGLDAIRDVIYYIETYDVTTLCKDMRYEKSVLYILNTY